MASEDLYRSLARQRRRLADLLDQLDADDWDVDSWCAGWRVRDVVGHLVSLAEVPTRSFIAGGVRERSFDKHAAKVACKFGERSPEDLRRAFTELIDVRKTPPIIGPIAPVTDVVVHTADIAGPLGCAIEIDPAAAGPSLSFLTGGRAVGFIPSSRTRGLSFSATDIDWSSGDGPLVEGPAGPLAAAVAGRREALEMLDGPGVAELSTRLA